MADQTTLTLTDERRRREDRLRELLNDELPDTQFRTTLYDMALQHLLDSLQNADVSPGDVCHGCRVAHNTSVVKHRSDAYYEVQRP